MREAKIRNRLEANEVPPPALLVHLAQQLDVDAGAFAVYAQRDQTRRTHLAELTRQLGLLALTVRLPAGAGE